MKSILFLGAGFLQKFLIKKARDMGYYVYALDEDENAVGFEYANEHKAINIVDKEKCLKFALEKKIDGVLTVSTDYGVLTASYIGEKLKLPHLNYESAVLVKNKYLVRKCFYENKIDDFEQFYLIKNIDELEKIKKKISYPLMVKPCDGSGSRATKKANNYEELKLFVLDAISNSISKMAELESFIAGNEYGVESIVINDKIYVLGIMKKYMTLPPFYAELGHSLPCDLSQEMQEVIKKKVENAIKALNINFGSVNMDILVSNNTNKVYIVDVGARMGGNMIGPYIIPIGTGYNYPETLIKASVNDNPTLLSCEKKCVSSKLLSFNKTKIISIPNIKMIENKYNVLIFHHMKVGESINEYHSNLDGCGYVIAISDNLEEAERNSSLALDEIRKHIYGDNNG